MPEFCHRKDHSRNGNHLDICCSLHTEGANFSNPDGYTSLRVIASPSLNQDQLWRLFDLVPGLDFLHLDTKSRLVCTLLPAWHTFAYFMFHWIVSKFAHTEKVLNIIELFGSWSCLDSFFFLRLRYMIVQSEMQSLPCVTITLDSHACATLQCCASCYWLACL
jgi:hypothetical protein